jgi:hypothetical protein
LDNHDVVSLDLGSVDFLDKNQSFLNSILQGEVGGEDDLLSWAQRWSFNTVLKEGFIGLSEVLIQDVLLLVADAMGSSVDKWVILEWLESIDLNVLALEVLQGAEMAIQVRGVMGPFFECWEISMLDRVSPCDSVVETLVLEDLQSFRVVVLVLEQPHDLVDVEDIAVVQVLLGHELKDVFGASVVQDVLKTVQNLVTSFEFLNDLQSIWDLTVGDESIVLGDGGWITAE